MVIQVEFDLKATPPGLGALIGGEMKPDSKTAQPARLRKKPPGRKKEPESSNHSNLPPQNRIMKDMEATVAQAVPAASTDAERVDAARGGDEQAFSGLYQAHAGRLMTVLWRLAGGAGGPGGIEHRFAGDAHGGLAGQPAGHRAAGAGPGAGPGQQDVAGIPDRGADAPGATGQVDRSQRRPQPNPQQ